MYMHGGRMESQATKVAGPWLPYTMAMWKVEEMFKISEFQTSQNFIRSMNLQVLFFLEKMRFLPTL